MTPDRGTVSVKSWIWFAPCIRCWHLSVRSAGKRLRDYIAFQIVPSEQAVHLSEFEIIWIFINQVIHLDCSVWNCKCRRHPRLTPYRFSQEHPCEQSRCSAVFYRCCRWFQPARWYPFWSTHAVQGVAISGNRKSYQRLPSKMVTTIISRHGFGLVTKWRRFSERGLQRVKSCFPKWGKQD